MGAPPYRVVKLPILAKDAETDHAACKLAKKLRNQRLYALKSEPEAFSASHERESARGLDYTIERLRNPKAAHFVAITQHEERNDVLSLSEAPWLGTVVLLGPREGRSAESVSANADPFATMTESSESSASGSSEGRKFLYHLNGVFVDGAVRGRGVGLALIEAAIRRARREAQLGRVNVKCSVLVDSMNTSAKRLYERAGFVVVGDEAYQQQPRKQVEGETESRERVALRLEYSRTFGQLVDGI